MSAEIRSFLIVKIKASIEWDAKTRLWVAKVEDMGFSRAKSCTVLNEAAEFVIKGLVSAVREAV